MQIFEALVVKISRGLDSLAGLILAGTALLVVVNILGRTLINQSILGTYEMVGFLTAAVVGLAMARCAVERGHITVTFILERFPPIIQRVVEIIIGIPVLVFFIFASYHLFRYGRVMAVSGEVAPTTQLIFYPFVYLVAIGFVVLALTVLLQVFRLVIGGEH
ncbi:MAG TPA: TRAP transporter small permease [Firmicutes bacterium]|nr:TRAP transporter small permease [Bacillota bacterium]